MVVGVSSDPAVEAAARAWHDRYGDRLVGVEESAAHNGVGELTIAAARAALAPLRKLHRKRRAGGETYCLECCHIIGSGYELTYQSWPCATAKLVYPAEELR